MDLNASAPKGVKVSMESNSINKGLERLNVIILKSRIED